MSQTDRQTDRLYPTIREMYCSYSIVIPVFNEEENIQALYGRLCSVLDGIAECRFEIFFVDDGSADGSLEMIRSLAKEDRRVKYISFSRNFGKEAALSAAVDHVQSTGVIFLDADLQHPPELISQMIELHRQGFDDVYAHRRRRAGESWLRGKTSSLYYQVLEKCAGMKIQMDAGDYRLLSSRLIEALRALPERQRCMKSLYSWVGFRKKGIYYDEAPRYSGATKFNYLKLINLAIDGITSFTTGPLRLASIFGALISLAALTYLCVFLMQTLIYGNPVAGYPSLLCIILFLGGIQLLSLGIMGEYVGRVFMETKQRPLYLIEETNLPIEHSGVSR